MDFFGEQRTRTQRSLLLYGLFFLIVFAHLAVALGIMALLLLTIFTGGIYHWVLILVAIWTIGSFVIGSFLEYRRLEAGGRAIAQRVGGVRLFIDHSQDAWEHSQGVAHQHGPIPKVRFSAYHIAVRDERDFPPVYRRYYEIAQQLAIASGVRMPILYVLPDEQGINGFVAGRHSQDMVLVVTQGAIDKLSDEGLYGLIGHEYGHILHGDATFNLQLMVVLAGLQLLYDWSDSINNFGAGNQRSHQNSHHNYFDDAVNRRNPLSQKVVDNHARSTESQTANFTTHSEWVSYWQSQSQSQQSSAKSQSRWLQNNNKFDSQAPRNIWTLLIHGLSFSSMASAQLIKHSFNRQRELLADATSVQLTRSPAIMETLQAIHQDSLGSRLTSIADINGLSHFFFASSGADLGDVSWFATHPSLAERMSAINAHAYHDFAVKVAKEKRINQQKIKEIYEQRRLGNWGFIKANSLSENKKEKNTQSSIFETQSALNNNKINNDKSLTNNSNDVIDKEITPFPANEIKNELDEDKGLEFVIKKDVVVEGRLQVQAQNTGIHQLLKPWQAKPDSDLPSDTLIGIDDRQKVSLPQYILNHSYHSLGAQALIEAVMLCHQGRILSTTESYDLSDIWLELANDKTSAAEIDNNAIANISSHPQFLAHTIDHKLLAAVAHLDRRLDNALIALAIKQLSQHDLSETAINESRLRYEASHSNQDHQHYVQQKKCRTMLMRYQQGIIELFEHYLTADLSQHLTDNIASEDGAMDKTKPVSTHSGKIDSRLPPILSLWQALQLQQLLPILSTVLNEKYVHAQPQLLWLWQQTLQAGRDDIYDQLDPSGQVFDGLDVAAKAMLILLAYRLSKDVKGQVVSALDSSVHISAPTSVLGYNNDSVAHYLVDLRRHARLIDIDLAAVSDANLQWLLLTAQNINSIQLLAVIEAVPILLASASQSSSSKAKRNDNYRQRQQGGAQIDYNVINNKPYDYNDYNDYRQWLSTLHTVMLHDTIVSQDEYDCLSMLANHWLGVRQLF